MYLLSRTSEQQEFASFEEEILRRASLGDTRSYLYILPTSAAARELIDRVTGNSKDRAITLPSILSLDDFIRRMARAIRPDLRVLSAAESAVFVELALKELLRKNALGYFEGESDPGPKLPIQRGTFERLVASIASLKENGISPDKLLEDISRAKSDAERLIADQSSLRRAADLAAIYKLYEAKLGTDLTDRSGQYGIVISHFELPSGIITELQLEKITRIFDVLFPEVENIFVGSFIRLPEPARLLLFALSRIKSADLVFGIDYEFHNEALFGIIEQFIDLAVEDGFKLLSITGSMEEGSNSFGKILRKRIFSASDSGHSPSKVKVFSHAAATKRDELRFVAKQIKSLLLHSAEPIELSRICVASYDQDSYAIHAREIFREYGIPANITDRARLDRSPLYLAFSALFELAEYNFSRRSVLRLLGSPYLLIRRANGVGVNSANLYKVITEYRLPQGSLSWCEEIDVHLEDIAERLEQSLDAYDIHDLQERHANLLEAKEDIEIIEKLLVTLRGEKAPSEFVAAIKGIASVAQVTRQILHSSRAMIEAQELEFDTRSYRAFIALLDELLATCRQLGLDGSSLPLSFFTERIRIASLITRFAPRAEPGRGVIVTSFDQTIGYQFDHVFLLGLNDGVFPAVYSPSLFKLKEHQSGEDEKLIEQRYLFYQTLSTATDNVTLIWHTNSDDRKSQIMRSQFVDAIEEIFPIVEISREGGEGQIFSANEYFRYSAMAGLSNTESIAIAKSKGLGSQSLLTLKDQIPHSIAVQKMRGSGAATEYSGVLPFNKLNEAERDALLKFQSRIFSISQLETYAICPFKFFSRYVLQLQSGLQGDTEEGLSSSERGIVLHDTLYRILSGLRDRGEDLRSLSDEEFRRLGAEILAGSSDEKLKPNHPFWRLDQETLFEPPSPGIGILEKFIEAERQYSDFITKPGFFEATFGMKLSEEKRDKALYREQHVELSGIKLRGKIDRIDIDEDAKIFSVTDYKSGKGASQKEIQSGLSLQLPLYLRIAEDLLRAHLGDDAMRGVAAVYHTLGKESKQKLALGLREFAGTAFVGKQTGKLKNGEFESEEALAEAIERTVEYAKSYVEGMTKGEFSLVKEENRKTACTYCDYKTVCRVGEAVENGALH